MAHGDPLTNVSQLPGRDPIDLLARVIYAENGASGDEARRATAWVVKNMVDCNKNEFKARSTYEKVILNPGSFSCVGNSNFMTPPLTHANWTASLTLATSMINNPSSVANPISTSLFFVSSAIFNNANNHKVENGYEYFRFPGSIWLKVTFKKDFNPTVNAVFFNLEGY